MMTGQIKGYFAVGLAEAEAGGVVVAVATRAVPQMMSRMMSGMMQAMATGMGEEGCSPGDM